MIDARVLIGLSLSEDGKSLSLQIRDQNDDVVSLSLPTVWLELMLNALPQPAVSFPVHRVDNWRVDRLSNGQDLVLTLHTLEGQEVSFAMTLSQVEGMATIATYGLTGRSPDSTVH